MIVIKEKFLAQRFKNRVKPPLAVVDDLAAKYKEIIDLSLGDPDYITHREIITSAFNDAKRGYTGYTDPLGDPELRKEISKYYQEKYKLKFGLTELMIVVGAIHGLYLTLEAILDEGDEVIIPEPYFTPYDQQVRLAGGKPIFLSTEEDNFQINSVKVNPLINNKTKAIIINNPNNPTGACLSRNNMTAIARLAREKDLLIISDEVYGAFSFKEPHTPIASLEGMQERTVIINSFSKEFAMTGWRIGYVIGPDYLINCIRNINEGICYSAPTISQRAALKALRVEKKIKESMIREFKERVFYAYQRLKGIKGFSVMEPQGSFYLFVNIKKTGLSSQEISRKILDDSRVLVVPGTAFGKSGAGYIRIACTLGKERLKDAFDRIEKMDIFQEEGSA